MNFYRRNRGPLLWALFLALLLQWLDYKGKFEEWNGPILDLILKNSSAKADSAASTGIFIVKIDDAAYAQCFGNQSPMCPSRVVNLVEEVSKVDPLVIGVDIFTEGDEYRDRQLDIKNRSNATIIWALAGRYTRYTASFPSWLLRVPDKAIVVPGRVLGVRPEELKPAPQFQWGFPVFPEEQHGTIRRFPRFTKIGRSEPKPSWAKQVADAFCPGMHCTSENAPEIYVSYRGNGPHSYKMQELFTCPQEPLKLVPEGPRWEEFKHLAKGKIVLIGGTFDKPHDKLLPNPVSDIHPTPAGHDTPGLIVNAYAVKAELEGNGFKSVSQPQAWLLDFALGVIILWACEQIHRIQPLLGPGTSWLIEREKLQKFVVGGTVTVLACGLFWHETGYLLNFALEGAGVVLDLILELSQNMLTLRRRSWAKIRGHFQTPRETSLILIIMGPYRQRFTRRPK